MKDYYYILGVKETASSEEIRKKAYRKLSFKFHPDKNDGDEFFSERFKEIQEAYEMLNDSSKKRIYDINRNQNFGYAANNFYPTIEYFTANNSSFEFGDQVTFSWHTINSNNVILKPIGIVPPSGQKTFKIKNINQSSINFELVAENTHISKTVYSTLVLQNLTYQKRNPSFWSFAGEKFNVKQSEPIGNKSSKPEVENTGIVLLTCFILFFLYAIIQLFS